MSLQVSKALLADYIAAQRKGKPMKGLGLEHMNSSRPVIPEELKSNLLRDPSIQVQFKTLQNFVKEVLYLKFLDLYFCTGWVWVFLVVYCNYNIF